MKFSAYLADTLHIISQGLLIPTMIILILLIIATVASAGSIVTEFATERRLLKASIPALIASLHESNMEEMKEKIQSGRILKRQKKALNELIQYTALPEQSLKAIAKKLIATEEDHYNRVLSLTDLVARVAPMFGLMGTLIPLGPGLLALGQGDTKTLANSLLIAFDTTVAGLIAAAVCYVISKIRSRWYEDYMLSIESIMESILEEAKSGKGSRRI